MVVSIDTLFFKIFTIICCVIYNEYPLFSDIIELQYHNLIEKWGIRFLYSKMLSKWLSNYNLETILETIEVPFN